MAVFGKLDAKAFVTDVAVLNGDATVTTAGDFTDANDNLIKAGDILELAGVPYIVKSVDSATSLELHTTYAAADATIAAANAVRRTAPKAVAEYVIKGGDSASYELVFVDNTEVAVASNKSRGITGPGWWQYRTFVDASGATRHKAEHIAFVSETAAAAGDDADDTIVADVLEVITISAQPASVGDGATTLELPSVAVTDFAVTATVDQGGTITYAWQRKLPGATRWVNIGGSTDGGVYTGYTGATLSVDTTAGAGAWGEAGSEDASVTAYDGIQFRVKLTSSKGAEEVISDTATLRLVNAA
jgi:hypothetical protein